MLWLLQIFVGSMVCVLVWHATHRVRPRVAKALVRAAPVALTLAPGVIAAMGSSFRRGWRCWFTGSSPGNGSRWLVSWCIRFSCCG